MARVVTRLDRGVHPTQLRKSTVGRLGIEHFLLNRLHMVMVSNGCGEEFFLKLYLLSTYGYMVLSNTNEWVRALSSPSLMGGI